MILAHMRSSLSIFVFGLYSEVLSLSKNAIARYLDLLEKAFIIKNNGEFSRNLRDEISKCFKCYF